MASSDKQFIDPEVGEYRVRKSKRAKRITMRINQKTGLPHVTIPSYAPLISAKQFVAGQREWIRKHAIQTIHYSDAAMYELYDGTQVTISLGKRNSKKISAGHIRLTLNARDDQSAQKYFLSSIEKRLLVDTQLATATLLKTYALRLQVQPSEVRYRSTTSRWGSCNSKRVLTFSGYIAQLPYDLIEYIVVHELCHITQMNHSSAFWQLVEEQIPDYKNRRKELKHYQMRPEFKKIR